MRQDPDPRGKESRQRNQGFNPSEVQRGRDIFTQIPHEDKKEIAITPTTPKFSNQIKPYVARIPSKDNSYPKEWRVLFMIEKGQNGECYHAIVAAVCHPPAYVVPLSTLCRKVLT